MPSAVASVSSAHASHTSGARRRASMAPWLVTTAPAPSSISMGMPISAETLATSSSPPASARSRSSRSFCMATVRRRRCMSAEARTLYT